MSVKRREDGDRAGRSADLTADAKAEAPATVSSEQVALLERRLQRLQQICLQLTSAVSRKDVVSGLLAALDDPLAAPTRGLWLIDDEGSTLDLVAHVGLPPGAAETFARMSVSSDLPGAVAYRERRSVHSSSVSEAEQSFPTMRHTLRHTEAFLAVPVVATDHCFGVLAVGYDGALPDGERQFVEAVAGYLAQTLARVQLRAALEAQAVDATELARREGLARLQLEFLMTLSSAALKAEDHRDLMSEVARAAVPKLGDWCAVHFQPDDDEAIETEYAHSNPDRVAWVRSVREQHPLNPSAGFGVASVMRSGETEFFPEVSAAVIERALQTADIGRDDALAILGQLALRSVITVPILTKRRVIGAMQFVTSADSGRSYTESDVRLAESAASLVAEALENLWLTDRHRDISQTLQRSLLPPSLPRIEGLDLAARYLPAGSEVDAGGDFYDAFAADGGWAFVIGDACGTGPRAASLTSVARHTFRALLRRGDAPADVMSGVNEAIRQSGQDLFCTACYATLRPSGDGWLLQTTAAGHPLPILRTGNGARQLGAPGTLLGVFEEVSVHPAETTLQPGDALILYTDGVTDLPPPGALSYKELAEFVTLLPDGLTADEIADAIEAGVNKRSPRARRPDDIALLVVRLVSAP